jgi:tetratricopeptide (TPR) repeat protein
MTTELEEQLIVDIKSGKDVDLERAILIASGISDESKLEKYQHKLGEIKNGLEDELDIESRLVKPTQTDIVKELYELIISYQQVFTGDKSFLPDIIDTYSGDDPTQKFWNCIGATTFYSILALKFGIDLTVVDEPGHIFNRLKNSDKNETVYDIEHTLDRNVKINNNPHGRESEVKSLVYFNFLNRADTLKEEAEKVEDEDEEKAFDLYKQALDCYDFAVQCSPEIADQAYMNRGVVKSVLSLYEENPEELLLEVEQDYLKSLEIGPDNFEVHFNLAQFYHFNGDVKKAKEYCKGGLRIDPENEAMIELKRDLNKE